LLLKAAGGGPGGAPGWARGGWQVRWSGKGPQEVAWRRRPGGEMGRWPREGCPKEEVA